MSFLATGTCALYTPRRTQTPKKSEKSLHLKKLIKFWCQIDILIFFHSSVSGKSYVHRNFDIEGKYLSASYSLLFHCKLETSIYIYGYMFMYLNLKMYISLYVTNIIFLCVSNPNLIPHLFFTNRYL